jgi:hypothetical protein
MMKLVKVSLALVGAMVLLGAVVATASARNLSVSSQTLRAAFREVILNGPFGTIACAVTVEGSFHQRTTAKIQATLVGYITSAILGVCSQGTATLLRETLPWHIRYLSFTGTLPNITTLRANVIGSSYRIRETFGTSCLGISTAAKPAIVSFNRDVVTRVATSASLGGLVPTDCGVEGGFTSTLGPITAGNNTTRITITLI